MRKIFLTSFLLIVIINPSFAQVEKISISTPLVIITNLPTSLSFNLSLDKTEKHFPKDTIFAIYGIDLREGDKILTLDSLKIINGSAKIENAIFFESGLNPISIPELNWQHSIRIIPGWLSLLPPLIAIILALIARQVLVALFVGVWIGAALIYDYNPVYGLLYGLTEYIGKAAADPDKMAIIIFSLALGGMVGVISKMGGTQGIVDKLAHYASDSRRGQIVTWLMGVFIFFDDYANTLIVGNTMRPLADKLKISREKLSYLVDSTAAPVANIAIISTWIGFEISIIGSSFNALGISDNAYLTFFRTIPYNFYPIFSLVLGFTIAWSGRDFGPMLKAEKRSQTTGQLLSNNATPLSSLDTKEMIADEQIEKKWYNGFTPIFVVIVATLVGLWFTGLSALNESNVNMETVGLVQYISLVVGESDSYAVLMWASFLGSIVAITMAISQKILSLDQSISAWIGGVKAMILAALILTMAWSIGNICTDLKTADYIIYISEDFLSPYFIPMLSFIIAALISFATGTSWGVMAILMPIVIPLAYLLPQSNELMLSAVHQQGIFLSTIASVLAGATFGDHCSPISDTTIMSSMASGADHIDHVKTQLPYALFGGILSVVVGYIPVGLGINPWFVLPIGIIIIIFAIRFVARKAIETQTVAAGNDAHPD